jgi:hypothetical protein
VTSIGDVRRSGDHGEDVRDVRMARMRRHPDDTLDHCLMQSEVMVMSALIVCG